MLLEKITPIGIDFAKAFFVILVGFFVIKYGSRFLKRIGTQYHSNYVGMILSKVAYYIGWFLVIMTALDKIGFNTTQILGAAGVIGVAVGFASQTSFSNIISGIFLIAEKPFVVGDKIQVDTMVGKIVSIDLLSIKLVSSDNDYIRIPNEFLIKNSFINLTRYPIKRISIEVQIPYSIDIQSAINILNNVVSFNRYSQHKDKIDSLVTAFRDSSIQITAYMWVNSKNIEIAKSSLMTDIKKRFDQESIEMPYQHIIVKNIQ